MAESMNRHDRPRHDLGGADFALDHSRGVSDAYGKARGAGGECAGRERQELGSRALGSDPPVSPAMGWFM
jgi:hypothetical protein